MKFAALAASPAYIEAALEQHRRAPQSLPPEWRLALDLIAEFYPEGPASADAGAALAQFLRQRGHLIAELDPLQRSAEGQWAAMGDVLRARLTEAPPELLRAYCGPLAVETGHIDDAARSAWIHQRREAAVPPSPDARRAAFEALIAADEFERFMGLRFPAKKRFGAEGAESFVPLLRRIIERAAANGVRHVVIAAMHRGRLNLLANVLGKPLASLFAEMTGRHPFGAADLAADVPYHLGFAGELQVGATRVRVSLLPNPSHLEAVNAVALGFARAHQERAAAAAEILPLLLHTDASVIGQGVVAEALQLSELNGYATAGTVHVVLNNQIGFTTEPKDARTSRHCTGAFRAVDSLIAHANADEIDAVLMAADLAVDYRTAFAADAVVDLVGYRRNGHNEIDEPRFTQPRYYARADGHRPVAERVQQALAASGELDEAAAQRLRAGERERLEAAYARLATTEPAETPDAAVPRKLAPPSRADLQAFAKALGETPEHFAAHPKVARLIGQRPQELAAGAPWALGEALAFASLLAAGTDVRLSGQDVERGAFSNRHLSIFDAADGRRFAHLGQLPRAAGRFQVHNSPLSEYAVLGFEYGYSLGAPQALTIWEAQFGDFANGAQIVIDQFIASGAEKWRQISNLVVLLPHGLEGQGPEHSSARPERLLQLAVNENFELHQPSTPANYFHLLRWHMSQLRPRPLFVLSPKKLLRLPAAVSPLAAFTDRGGFQPVIATGIGSTPRRVVLCGGKIAYELEAEARRQARRDVAILRLEQIHPLPVEALTDALAPWGEAELVWLQEEPENFGVWPWLSQRFPEAMRRQIGCVARAPSSSPAGSFHGDHDTDQASLLDRALRTGPIQGETRR